MRELVDNEMGGHFRPSAPCCYVEGFPQTAFQDQQPAAVDPAAVAFVPSPGTSRLSRRTEIAPQWGALPFTEASVVPCAAHWKKCRIRSAHTTGRWMGNFVKSRVVVGAPPNRIGWATPAPVASDRLAEGQRPTPGQREACTAGFVREVGRAVAPAVGPRVAAPSLESSPIPRHSAARGLHALPTYLRHPEVSA